MSKPSIAIHFVLVSYCWISSSAKYIHKRSRLVRLATIIETHYCHPNTRVYDTMRAVRIVPRAVALEKVKKARLVRVNSTPKNQTRPKPDETRSDKRHVQGASKRSMRTCCKVGRRRAQTPSGWQLRRCRWPAPLCQREAHSHLPPGQRWVALWQLSQVSSLEFTPRPLSESLCSCQRYL